LKKFSILLLFGVVAAAQQARFSAPVLGYVYDPGARALRVISGVPGAATLEEALVSDLDETWVAPARHYAISNDLRIIAWSQGVSETRLPSPQSIAKQVTFSPSGSFSAIAFGTELEVWAGLPENPRLAAKTATDPDAVIAVADDGTVRSGSYKSIVFLAGSQDVVTSDSSGTWLARSGGSTQLLTEASGPLAVSPDNRRVFVGDTLSKSILQVDLASGDVQSIPCECDTELLERVSGGPFYRSNKFFKEKLLLLSVDGAEPRILTVPGGGL
jgi:hypothetical protein